MRREYAGVLTDRASVGYTIPDTMADWQITKITTVTHSHETFRDIDLYRDAFINADLRSIQIDRGELRIQWKEVTFKDCIVRQNSLNRAMVEETTLDPGWTCLALARAHDTPEIKWCGVDVVPDSLVVLRPGREHYLALPAGFNSLEFWVSDALLVENDIASDDLLNKTMSPEHGQLFLPRAFAGELRHRLYSLLNSASVLDVMESSSDLAKVLRSELIELLLQSVGISSNDHDSGSGTTARNKYALVRRALGRIRDPDAPIVEVEALCGEIGISQRQLRRAFSDVLGVSPYQYLLIDRLNAARTDLYRNRDETTVSEIAMRYGFTSASRFTEYYRRLFGELPSLILRYSR